MRKRATLALALLIAVSSSVPANAQHHWLFPNHPRLRRITKAVGFGAATGGVLAPVLGAGAATGAMMGAAEHGAVRGVKDTHDIHHHKHLDRHFW